MDKKWTLIGDSACDLFSKDLTSEKINFVTVPLEIALESGNVVDDEDLDIADFVDKMRQNKTVAKTACPPTEKFAAAMREGDNVIVVTISSKLSGTYQSATVAAETVKKEFPDKKIYVLDSLGASASETKILYQIQNLIENTDLTYDEVVSEIISFRDKTRTRFFLQSLQNLAKNGRIGKILGIVTRLTKLKLVCGENGEGEIVKYGVALTKNQGLKTLAKFPEAKAEEDPNLPIVITHCFNEQDAITLKDLILAKFKGFKIKILKMRGLASFYGDYKGIIMGY